MAQTPRFLLDIIQDGQTGWGDILNTNLLIIDEHLAGQLNELQDVSTTGKLNGSVLQYSTGTNKWAPGNPTLLGIQTHAGFPDLETDSHKIYLMHNGSIPMSGDLNMAGNRITNIHAPELPNDPATKQYVDTGIGEIAWMPPVRSKGLLDPTGVTVANGDRFIVGSPTPIGAWAGHANDIAIYIEGEWSFIDPTSGMTMWVDAESKWYTYHNSVWRNYEFFLDHNQMINVSDANAHPQYLNTARHADMNLHIPGVTVPYQSIYTLAGTNIISPADTHILVYDAVNEYWKNVPATALGAKLHSDLDATSCANANCHPQYLTEDDHTALLHSFVKLNDMSDVDTVSNPPINGNILQYYDPIGNGTGTWVNRSIPELHISHHDLVNMGDPYDDHLQYYHISGSREIMGDLVTKKDIKFRSNTALTLSFVHSITGSDKQVHFPNQTGMAMITTAENESQIASGSFPYCNTNGAWVPVAPPSNLSSSEIYSICLNTTSKVPEWRSIPTFPTGGAKGDLIINNGSKWATIASQVANGSVLTSNLTGDVRWKTTAADFAALDSVLTTPPTGDEILAVFDPVSQTYKRVTHKTLFKRKRTIILNAGSALTDLASGGATMKLHSTGAGSPSYYYVEFQKTSTPEHCQWLFTMPESWDGGAITAKAYWNSGENRLTGVVKWGVVGIRMDESSQMDSQFKTSISTYMSQQVTNVNTHTVHITPEIALNDITGTSGNLMCLSLTRGDTSSGDTVSQAIRFLQLRLEYTVNQASD